MKDEKDIIGFIDDIIDGDPKLAAFEKDWGPLASFLNEYEHLKAKKGLTQKDIANACGTTQSAISRLERMRGKPAYELLRKLSAAVGGELYLSPLADVSVTLPVDLQDKARSIAEKQGLKTQDLLENLLREGIINAEYRDAFGEANCTVLIALGGYDIPHGEYGGNCSTEGDRTISTNPADCSWGTAV